MNYIIQKLSNLKVDYYNWLILSVTCYRLINKKYVNKNIIYLIDNLINGKKHQMVKVLAIG